MAQLTMATPTSAHQPSVASAPRTGITPGLTIKGHLSAREDLVIEGVFEGSIDLPDHHLMTSAHSRINAAVSARVVTVEGRLEGHINADVVDIVAGALVDANVMAKSLALEEGARFNGSVNTERARAALEIARHRLAQKAG
jgi:cytoskeletal protein CcmA (bactofilin family)